MIRWNKLSLHEKEVLASRYGVTCIGNMQPANEAELDKIPASEWDRLIQKEIPVRKTVDKKVGVAKPVAKEVKPKKVSKKKK